MAERTPEQQKKKKSQDAYMSKLKDIKIRVPLDYFDIIKKHVEKIDKKMSVHKWILSLIENDIKEPIVSIREQNKMQKEKNKSKE